mgnify:CR=1 FL=1
MRRILVGHTGFVGGHLDRHLPFEARYNSRNFHDMAGETADEVVCAGIQAVKWWANAHPDEDLARIEALLAVLEKTRAKRFVLISTVDVYRDPTGVNERSPTPKDGLHAYGLNRLRVEEWVRERYEHHLILRLPGLYGAGLKKNLIFDALTGGDLSGFDARARFQFYDLARIGAELIHAKAAGLSPVNLAVGPVTAADVVRTITGARHEVTLDVPPPDYDMRTIHARVWEREGAYLQTAEECLAEIADFAARWRASALP